MINQGTGRIVRKINEQVFAFGNRLCCLVAVERPARLRGFFYLAPQWDRLY